MIRCPEKVFKCRSRIEEPNSWHILNVNVMRIQIARRLAKTIFHSLEESVYYQESPMVRANGQLIGIVLICTVSLCFGARSVSSQVLGGQADAAGPFSASLERRQAEQNLRALPQRIREKREQNFKDPRVLKQMNEDFLMLQTIQAEMAKTFAAGGLHQSSKLKESSADVRRRATRLRSLLLLSEEPEDFEIRLESSPTIESLNDRAFQLCLEISRFTENPMFRANGVITARQVTEAAKALDTVIALAEAIQKELSRVR